MIAKLKANRVRRTYLGGGRIDAFTGEGAPKDGALRPEDWLASTTTAFNGSVEIEGEGLGRLEDGRLVRDAVGTLPILVKLLDSDERLVIQAHPTVPLAQKYMGSPVGKTECWYFLPGTNPHACVYLGFKPGITRDIWRTAVAANIASCEGTDRLVRVGKDSCSRCDNAQRLLDLMHKVSVRPGDLVFVDGGVPHAIGAGCFMIELQEPSDLMVVAERFTPSGREIPEKKLHGGLGWEKMYDVYTYEGMTAEALDARYIRRATRRLEAAHCVVGPELTDKFEEWVLASAPQSPTELALQGAKAVVVITEGEGRLGAVDVRKGDRLVIVNESTVRLTGAATAVVCFQSTSVSSRSN